MAAAVKKAAYRFIDIGANLTDPVFRGIYHGSTKHKDDFMDILNRAYDIGMEKIMVTGGSLSDSREALELAKAHDNLYSTVGCHPTRCGEFDRSGDADKYMNDLIELAQNNKDKVVAVGEFGLDYDRTRFCHQELQFQYFEKQFVIAEATNLPLFLHSRSAAMDFQDIIKRKRDSFKDAVVHSFTGTKEEAKTYLDLGLYIGINGCSLKTADNVEAMCTIPSDRLMLETDAPWCEIKNTHVGSKNIKTKFLSKKKERYENGAFVKGRNEPAAIIQVLEVMAHARDEDIDELANAMYENTCKVFFPSSK